jgi:hypothetical protein
VAGQLHDFAAGESAAEEGVEGSQRRSEELVAMLRLERPDQLDCIRDFPAEKRAEIADLVPFAGDDRRRRGYEARALYYLWSGRRIGPFSRLFGSKKRQRDVETASWSSHRESVPPQL